MRLRWWRRRPGVDVQRAQREAERQRARAYGQTPKVDRVARRGLEQATRASVFAELVAESWRLRETR